MQITQQINVSFEFFPPKTPEGVKTLNETAAILAKCNPQFFSVTYGAAGSTREGTLETLNILQQQTGIEVAPHLACIGSTRAEILEVINQYKQAGVRRMVALRGDLPSGMGQAGEFKYASELITLIRATTQDYFHIEVAAYPEIHPQALSTQDDILNLKRKQDAGADSAITQYFFNPDAYFYYLDDCAKQGIHLPIVPGIMPITQFSRLARFSVLCGAEIPQWIRKRLEGYGDDIQSIQSFGLDVVHKLCERLIGGGAPGLHFYTLNKADNMLELLQRLGLISLHSAQPLKAQTITSV